MRYKIVLLFVHLFVLLDIRSYLGNVMGTANTSLFLNVSRDAFSSFLNYKLPIYVSVFPI